MGMKTSFWYLLLSAFAVYLTILNKLKQAQFHNEINCNPKINADLYFSPTYSSFEFAIFANFCIALCDFLIRVTVIVCLGNLEKIEQSEMINTFKICVFISVIAITFSSTNLMLYVNGERTITIRTELDNVCNAKFSDNNSKIQQDICRNPTAIDELKTEMCCLAQDPLSTSDFIILHLRTLSLNREIKIVHNFIKSNYRFFCFLILSLQISLAVLRSVASTRSTDMWTKKNSISSLIKMLCLLSIFLCVYIPECMEYWDLDYLKKIGSMFIAYEVFEVLESFSIIATCLVAKFSSFNMNTMQSCYLFMIQCVVTGFISVFTLGTIFSIQVFVMYLIKITFQFEEMATHLIAMCHFSNMFTVSKSEIARHNLDDICILCQSEISEGVLLSCNHVFHHECLKQSYSADQHCLSCQKYIEFPQDVSDLHVIISKERKTSL